MRPLNFLFKFCFVDEDLKHEIEFIIKNNESLAEIKQLLLKYKHGNNIHENEKQLNK